MLTLRTIAHSCRVLDQSKADANIVVVIAGDDRKAEHFLWSQSNHAAVGDGFYPALGRGGRR